MSNPFHYLQSLFPETTRTLNFGSNELEWLEAFLANLTVTTRATVPTPVNATDATTKAYVDALFSPTIATIQEADGSPSVTNPTTLRFDQADGFVLSEPTTGVVRVDLDDIPYAAIQNVSTTDRLLGRETAGAGVIEEIVCTAAGRALLDDASAAAQRTTLGSTTVGDALFITASAAAARTTLGLAIGTDVQAWDADLDALAALAATAGMLSRTGAGAFTVRTLTGTANRITVADGTGAAGNPTFDVGTDVYTVGGTDVAVGDGGTALSSGTSGGVLAFTGATTLASSAALLASAVVLGGGAGAVPATMTDPGADRLIFWDESANATVYLTAGTGLTITDTTITASSGPSAASQAEMEAASSTTVYASPGRTRYHPGVAKFFSHHDGTGGDIESYNVTSVTDTGTGDHTINLTTAFTDTNAGCFVTGIEDNTTQILANVDHTAAGTVRLRYRNTATPFSLTDPPGGNWNASGFGDQA